MSARFSELAWSDTQIGQISLRKRLEPVTGQEIYEVKLGDEFLMSSLFTMAEEELARLCLERRSRINDSRNSPESNKHGLDNQESSSHEHSSYELSYQDHSSVSVVVGGLGLGFTAATALDDAGVAEMIVVEFLQPVIDWHREGLIPHGATLTADSRCRLVHGDFFAMSDGPGFDPDQPGREFDVIALDIDHSPQHHLDEGNQGFYGLHGTQRLARHLKPGGVYGMWSDEPPDQTYLDTLNKVFTDVAAEVITFHNPLRNEDATATIYLATRT